MRNFIILLLLFPCLVFSQVNQIDENGLRQGFWQKKYPSGTKMYEGFFENNTPVGEWKRYHENGRLKANIKYHDDTANTQLFDLLGKLIAEGNYINQKKDGTWKYYNNGRLVSEEFYIQDLKNGTSKIFYETGVVLEEAEWKQGKQDCNYQLFYENGKPYLQCKMANNQKHGLCIIRFTNGRPELVAGYKNNLRHGEWKYHNEQGEFLYSLIYENGFLMNPEVRDSIENTQLKNLEKTKHNILDPEQFMENPTEYMTKLKIYD